jgi:hypothetical protein
MPNDELLPVMSQEETYRIEEGDRRIWVRKQTKLERMREAGGMEIQSSSFTITMPSGYTCL